MIQIHILTHEASLKQLHVIGHAKMNAEGASVCCAAVSVLIQSVAGALAEKRIPAKGSAESPGKFFLEIADSGTEWLRGLTAVLLSGIHAVLREYPKELKVEILEA